MSQGQIETRTPFFGVPNPGFVCYKTIFPWVIGSSHTDTQKEGGILYSYTEARAQLFHTPLKKAKWLQKPQSTELGSGLLPPAA